MRYPHFPFCFHIYTGKVSAFDGDEGDTKNKDKDKEKGEKGPQSKGVLVTDTYAFNEQFT